MKNNRKKWLFFGYVAALTLSFLLRQATKVPSPPNVSEWNQIQVSREGKEAQPTRLAWRELGPAGAPKLLLIHGSPVASSCFDRLIPELIGNYRLIIPDLPGFGYSRNIDLKDYSIKAHAQYLSDFIEKTDKKNLTLVGYSMGGGVAIHLEDLQPDRIDQVVMLASIGVQENELLGDYMLNHVIHGLQLTVLSGAQELIPHFGLLDRFPLNTAYARNFYDSDQRPLRGLLKKWDKPLQIIHGENDRLVPPSAAEEHYRIVPQSRLDWVKNGSHIDLIRRPEEVARLIDLGHTSLSAPSSPIDPARLAAAAETPKPNRIDKTFGGAVTVATLLALSTFGSEDLSCISGGLMTSRKVVQYSTATIGCLVGIFVSDIALYLLGKFCSQTLTRFKFIRKRLESFRVDAGKAWLEENAAKLIVVSRFIPGSRFPTYVAMGASEVNFKKFTTWLLIAATAWTPILVGVSASFGERLLPFLEKHEKLIFPGFIALLIFGGFMIRFLSLTITWKGRRLLVSQWRRLTRWEFWPSGVIYLFLLPTVIKKAIQHRSITVFTAANPGLPCGGFAIEPKLISLNALKDSGNVPKFREVSKSKDVSSFMDEEDVSFPVVLKPDEGERGRGVAIIHTIEEAEKYLSSVPEGVSIIAQSFVPGKEYGVFYYRYPEEKSGRIYAVTEKRMVHVTGDGKRTLEDLILADDRAVCMAPFFLKQLSSRRWEIPKKGEHIQLSQLGTHARGAVFLDGSHCNTPELAREIDRITKHFKGFFFGRYDLKVPTENDLEIGKGIEVLELNGVTSEATSMYDPIHGLKQGLKILKKQWEMAYDIGAANRDKGHQPATFFELYQNLRSFWQQEKFESP